MNLFFHLNFPRKKQKNKKTNSKAASRPVRPSHSETTSRTERRGRGTRAGTGSSWEVRERERGGGAAPPLFLSFPVFFPLLFPPLFRSLPPPFSLSLFTPHRNNVNAAPPPEGAGVLVLESLEHARARGATILCEFAGGALGCDAHHMTEPRPDGSGVRACIEQAVRAGERASRFLAFRRSRSILPLRESGRGGRRKFYLLLKKKAHRFFPPSPPPPQKPKKTTFLFLRSGPQARGRRLRQRPCHLDPRGRRCRVQGDPRRAPGRPRARQRDQGKGGNIFFSKPIFPFPPDSSLKLLRPSKLKKTKK